MKTDVAEQSDHITITAEHVSAYVAHNSVPSADLPALIRSVHGSLTGLDGATAPESAAEALKPFVPVKKSVTEDYIVSLEDGRRFKSMKRYLAGLGMTPDQYQQKWGLSKDYPMVAPAYASKRSELARAAGLGRKTTADVAPETEAELEETTPAPKRRGRPKAA